MSRIKRILRTVLVAATAASLLLLVVLLVFWVRSYVARDTLRIQRSMGPQIAFFDVSSNGGRVMFLLMDMDPGFPFTGPPHWDLQYYGGRRDIGGTGLTWPTFGSSDEPANVTYGGNGGSHVTTGHTRSWLALIPFWLLVAASAVLPVFVGPRLVRERRRHKRRAQGRCLHCGYDLRATPDVCPECGSPVTGDSASAGDTESKPAPSPAGGG